MKQMKKQIINRIKRQWNEWSSDQGNEDEMPFNWMLHLDIIISERSIDGESVSMKVTKDNTKDENQTNSYENEEWIIVEIWKYSIGGVPFVQDCSGIIV